MNKTIVLLLGLIAILQGCSSSPSRLSYSELRTIEEKILEEAKDLNCSDLVKFKREITEPVRSCQTYEEPEQSKCTIREEVLEKLFENCGRNKAEKKRLEIEAENVINNNININNNNN